MPWLSNGLTTLCVYRRGVTSQTVLAMKLYVFPADESLNYEDLLISSPPPELFLETRFVRAAALAFMSAACCGFATFALIAG